MTSVWQEPWKPLGEAGAGAERRHISSDQIAYLRQEMRGKGLQRRFLP